MAKRRVMTEEEKRRKELVRELLKLSPLKNGEDLNDMMKEIISEMVGGTLEGELDDELGYDRYDYENKNTTNSRNGYGKKTLKTSYGEIDVKMDDEKLFRISKTYKKDLQSRMGI